MSAISASRLTVPGSRYRLVAPGLGGEWAGDLKTQTRDRAQRAAAAAQNAASSAGTRVTDFVEEKPTASLLIAFGVGLLFGSFVRRS